MHNQPYANADNESLQTDVMRFMAIIAFCLIAILALVKNAPPPETETVANVPEPPVVEPVPAPEPVVVRVRAPPLPEPVVRERIADSKVPVGAASAANAAAPQTNRSRLRRPQLKPLLRQRVAAEAEAAPTDRELEGLSLRFASEGDFLRLISRGDVTVFAYRDDAVWGLSRDYVFRNTRAPKQIYELEPNTIPQLVSDAFLRNHASPSNFTWGVSLPRRIESQIQSYIQRVENGVLLIDRFGEVRHVGTS